jgi:hypothetical protein
MDHDDASGTATACGEMSFARILHAHAQRARFRQGWCSCQGPTAIFSHAPSPSAAFV